MRLGIILGLVMVLSSVAVAEVTTTRAAATRPTQAIAPANCVTSECHAAVKATPVIHGPVATNHCDGCHELTSASRHTFKPAREGAEMCTYCHEFSVAGLPAVHKPVANGQCLGCHDPHGGQTHTITREQTIAQLCRRCHGELMTDKKFVHGPVAQGACDSCHTPHASKFPKLLDVVGSDLCLACHQELEQALAPAKHKHKALEKGCGECHDAHGSNAPMSLTKAVPALCEGCHEKTQQKIASAKVTHSAVSKDRSCMNCHAAHASNAAKLLTDLPAATCLKCHDKPTNRADGSVVAAVPEVADAGFVKHGEIKDGQCSGCHEVHGGANALLLAKPYSQAFYQNFSADNYALCFSCHDAGLAKDRTTTKATGFRNGDENLHFIHANVGTRDKNCRICHLPHAGANAKILRTSMKFGRWNMPVAFEKTPTGGSCMPGCHPAYAYDRDKPLPKATSSTLPLARRPAAARSEREDAKMISWSALDVNGAEVAIPGTSGKPIVLVLMSTEDGQNTDLINAMKSAAKHVAASYVLIVGGKDAEGGARSVLQAASGWPVVADPSHDAAHALGVSGWPMVLVLRKDGMEIARLSGGADFLPVKLDAYLDVAGGLADADGIARRIATNPVAESNATTRLSRDLRIARILLEERKPTQALAYLDRETTAQSASAEVQALRADAMIQLKQSEEAMAILNRLPADALPAPGLALLRSRANIAQEQWNFAREPLEETVKQFPDCAEAHQLLGRVYEHDGNFARAAEQYRLAIETKDRR